LSLFLVCESSVAVKRLAGKTISEMIYNVSCSMSNVYLYSTFS